jgi:hypothetical protein
MGVFYQVLCHIRENPRSPEIEKISLFRNILPKINVLPIEERGKAAVILFYNVGISGEGTAHHDNNPHHGP